jgi:serine/threonine protein kinase
VSATAADGRILRRLPNGNYRLLKNIGRGGYAEVFLAEHRERPGEFVAFKRPLAVPYARERMAREIEVQRTFDNPHVMPILDAAEDGSWFVMPVAEGNLEDLWSSGKLGRDPDFVATEILNAVALGLEPGHDAGYVHRDISPRNILALADEAEPCRRRWVVADWGAVKRPAGESTDRYTRTGDGLGTQGFAAPETWDDAHHVGCDADVYSIGRVVAWLLTGKWPAPNVPRLPGGPMRGLVAECTEFDPRRRISDVRALRGRLSVLLDGPPLSPRATVAELVQQAIDGTAKDISQVFALARQHPDDEALYLDEFARLPREEVAAHTRLAPNETAEMARTMLKHLMEADWGRRNFNYANVPLAWVHTTLVNLLVDDRAGTAEDLATEYFKAEEHWNRYDQLNRTVRWLKSLPESHGAVMGRAMRRAGVAGYYKAAVGGERVQSRSLAAELGL